MVLRKPVDLCNNSAHVFFAEQLSEESPGMTMLWAAKVEPVVK